MRQKDSCNNESNNLNNKHLKRNHDNEKDFCNNDGCSAG